MRILFTKRKGCLNNTGASENTPLKNKEGELKQHNVTPKSVTLL